MPKLIINNMLGLNSSQASLQLRPQEVGNLQNIRQRPFGNWVKRNGIELTSVGSSPVMGIFSLELDNITIPIVQQGTALTFFPDMPSANGTLPPSFFDSFPPVTPPLDPDHNRVVIFNVEQTMRAIQDRRVTAGHAAATWPNLIFKSDGTRWNGSTGIAVSNYPANNLYGPDLAFHDSFYGNPQGTRAASLVNTIISVCRDTVGFNDWINTDTGIEGQASVTYFSASIFPALDSATKTNYSSTLNDCKVGIRKLTSIYRAPRIVSVEEQTHSASDITSCAELSGIVYTIQGYYDGFFDISCSGQLCPNGLSVWLAHFDTWSIGGSSCVVTSNAYQGQPDVADISGTSIAPGPRITIGPGGTTTLSISVRGSPTEDCSIATTVLWEGTRVNDQYPNGTYTKTGGCASGPSTLEIIEL